MSRFAAAAGHRRNRALGAAAAACALGFAAALAAVTPATAGTHPLSTPRWSISDMVTPTGSSSTFDFSVSCSASQACTAGADELTSGAQYLTVAERWDGHWALQKTPDVAGSTGDEDTVTGVSCPAGSDCVLVGTYETTTDDDIGGLVERWNGSDWTVEDGPAPAGAEDVDLNGVTCSSAGDCTAVGEYNPTSGGQIALAARSDGSGWQVQTVKDPKGSDVAQLHGVSCPAAKVCTAVGTYAKAGGGNYSVAYRWNGSTWKLEKTPNPRHSNDIVLWSVSCASAKACMAVGSDEVTTGTLMFTERWNGSSWALQKVPAPSGSKGSTLVSVDCVSARDCVAVGQNDNRSDAVVPLIERWNGKSWKVAAAPEPAHVTVAYLDGVSCVSASTCVAVGTEDTGEVDYHPFAEIERK